MKETYNDDFDMNDPRDIIEYLLKDKARQFAEWAFGENFETIPFSEMPSAWNNIHPTEFKLDGYGNPRHDIPRLIEIWNSREDRS